MSRAEAKAIHAGAVPFAARDLSPRLNGELVLKLDDIFHHDVHVHAAGPPH